MSEITWHRVGLALLGRWPAQVGQWGEEAVQAYLEELQADGLDPVRALTAIRSYRPPDGKDFPPSVAAVSELALTDPDRPTFEELLEQLWGPGGLFGFKRSGVTISPWVERFADSYGRERLRMLQIEGDYGNLLRRQLQQSWEQFLQATASRSVAEIARRSTGLERLSDPLSVAGVRREIGDGR